MSEFIREVDEEYRHDQIRNILGRYWIALATVAVAVLVGVGGWRGYVYERQQQNEAAGQRYFDATQMQRGDQAGSLAALDALTRDGPAGYRLLARFRAATEVGQTDASAGVRAFDALADDPAVDPHLRDIAKLRAAMLLMDAADPAEIRRRFEPLADANAPFRNIAREMLAVTALKRGDDADAKRWLDAELSDPIAAQDQRQRAGLFLGLIRSGKPGDVPPPGPPASLSTAPPPSPPVDNAPPAFDQPPAASSAAPPVVDQPPAAKP